ncbi:MAG: glycosyltransferase family 2 protein [Chloroflexi bacterium]|nr:MAG: glycosyltransferase family 2 protein [Chloroflexota bacterium]
MATAVDVLVPTFNRPASLAITLTSLASQSFHEFCVIVSDQTEEFSVDERPEVRGVLRILEAKGVPAYLRRNRPRRGMAEQRQFLLEQAMAPYVLYLDDDLVLERDVVARLQAAMIAERCGFVGSAPIGLSHINDVRLHEQAIEFWDGPVLPEEVTWEGTRWQRHRLHNAANIFHVAQRLRLTPECQRLYKVAWVGGCVLFDRRALLSVGGFSFWRELPEAHCGEDVLAQLRVMRHYGGCAVLPSGTYHLELPTTLPDRRINAPELLPVDVPLKTTMIAQ